jgi:hypothetical protein
VQIGRRCQIYVINLLACLYSPDTITINEISMEYALSYTRVATDRSKLLNMLARLDGDPGVNQLQMLPGQSLEEEA